MDKKVAVYICQGCEIGGSLDIEALNEVVTDECEIELCREHACLCGDAGHHCRIQTS